MVASGTGMAMSASVNGLTIRPLVLLIEPHEEQQDREASHRRTG